MNLRKKLLLGAGATTAAGFVLWWVSKGKKVTPSVSDESKGQAPTGTTIVGGDQIIDMPMMAIVPEETPAIAPFSPQILGGWEQMDINDPQVRELVGIALSLLEDKVPTYEDFSVYSAEMQVVAGMNYRFGIKLNGADLSITMYVSPMDEYQILGYALQPVELVPRIEPMVAPILGGWEVVYPYDPKIREKVQNSLSILQEQLPDYTSYIINRAMKQIFSFFNYRFNITLNDRNLGISWMLDMEIYEDPATGQSTITDYQIHEGELVLPPQTYDTDEEPVAHIQGELPEIAEPIPLSPPPSSITVDPFGILLQG